ncbi:MAG: hypothetical protein LBL42_05970 [Tannerella sp.]|jgi:hypothetical protein|nr:hypothetical protein [Tannerella sp.]
MSRKIGRFQQQEYKLTLSLKISNRFPFLQKEINNAAKIGVLFEMPKFNGHQSEKKSKRDDAGFFTSRKDTPYACIA